MIIEGIIGLALNEDDVLEVPLLNSGQVVTSVITSFFTRRYQLLGIDSSGNMVPLRLAADGSLVS